MTSDKTRVLMPLDEPLTPVQLACVKVALAAQGLHLITELDRAVLKAMTEVETEVLRQREDNPWLPTSPSLSGACRAELTRRGVVKRPTFKCGSCRDTGKWASGIVCPACGGLAAEGDH